MKDVREVTTLRGHLVEISAVTNRQRALLSRTPTVEALLTSTLAGAQRRYRMKICFAVYLPQSYHLLLIPGSRRRLELFMTFVNQRVGGRLGPTLGWSPGNWPRYYRAFVVPDGGRERESRLEALYRLALSDPVFFTQLEDVPTG